MMIQTSYYQKSGSLPNAVGISQGVPKWYKGELYKKLAPPWEIVKIENEATFRRLYHEMVLSKLNPVHVADDLEGKGETALRYRTRGLLISRSILTLLPRGTRATRIPVLWSLESLRL
jgi:hypothetical protein